MTLLRQTETVRLDPDRLDALVSRLGPQAAEDVVSRALDEVSARLAQAELFFGRGDMREMRKCVRGLAAISEQLGMAALSRVARDVAVCGERGDAVALAATLARLVRVGEVSLLQVWEFPVGP